jgi:hypothetical protein
MLGACEVSAKKQVTQNQRSLSSERFLTRCGGIGRRSDDQLALAAAMGADGSGKHPAVSSGTVLVALVVHFAADCCV